MTAAAVMKEKCYAIGWEEYYNEGMDDLGSVYYTTAYIDWGGAMMNSEDDLEDGGRNK